MKSDFYTVEVYSLKINNEEQSLSFEFEVESYSRALDLVEMYLDDRELVGYSRIEIWKNDNELLYCIKNEKEPNDTSRDRHNFETLKDADLDRIVTRVE